ncbi:MAG TPA: cobalt-precorrin-5B (C(1))-methyltransferase, partial [Anaerolineae bacterium]|nr:cobalt-precorrin-5B (C(1))-methyltransferase [Anaerolineae bacterium]
MRMVRRASTAGKRLRQGYTTGTCAAAAAAAAVKMLFSGETMRDIDVELPDESIIAFNLVKQEVDNGAASCGIVKDAGDDPDVTDGMTIYAKATPSENGISIITGEGIGVV